VNVGQILQSFEHFSSVKMAKYDTYLEDCWLHKIMHVKFYFDNTSFWYVNQEIHQFKGILAWDLCPKTANFNDQGLPCLPSTVNYKLHVNYLCKSFFKAKHSMPASSKKARLFFF
jgi:hypothetical protein